MTRQAFLGLGLLLLWALAAACGGSDSDGNATESTPAGDSGMATPAGTPSRDPSHRSAPDPAVRFERGALSWGGSPIEAPTTLAFGPDGRLYVGQLNGQIVALTIEDRVVTDVEVVVAEDVFGDVLGLAFNPLDPPEPVALYVSHTQLYGGAEGPPFAGAIARLTRAGGEWQIEDVITGLPVSAMEHGTNGIAFDGEGRLFIAQGGSTNAGVPSERHPRPETPLSAAILVADLQAPGFDGAVRHEPVAATHETDLVSGDVRVYAAGFRNPYDVVVHSNGHVYVTDNGPNPPDGPASVNCQDDLPGPNAPDELNLILEAQYYGHPNRNRARDDARQCVYRTPLDPSGESTPPIATLGYSTSANGLAEYTAGTFDGRLRGDLIYVEWVKGRVWRVTLSEDGTGVASISQLVPDELERPLDVTMAPDGTIYIAEMGADRIVWYAPARPPGR